MRQFHTADKPSTTVLDRPPCRKCGWTMWLARIEPDKPDHDKRTFECPKCAHKSVAIVKYR